MSAVKDLFKFIVCVVDDFSTDNAATLGAALAFYTALSLAPLLMIFLFIAGLIGSDAQIQLVNQIQSLVGPQASAVIDLVIDNLRKQHHTGATSAVIGGITLLISATGVFAQLQFSMNTIWDVHAKPGNDVWTFIRQRLLSLTMMAVTGFLTLASLVISAALNFVFSGTGMWETVDSTASFAVYVLIFALIYKVLPDVRLAWRDVWIGALITAMLFVIGKFAIGKYLGYSSVGSAYGAAGSLVVLLLWFYYTSLIVFFGAEITQVRARRYDRGMVPKNYGEMNPHIKGRRTTTAAAEAQD
ncbi:MAG TPA: YihY/virulence factor BrkB family protein [bacterium]|jgi:membrane protein